MLFPTRFRPPLPSEDTPTEAVYLFQYSSWGHHSLGFIRDKQLIEFTYGDWDLFALDKRDTVTAITHMLWPTLGALGKKCIAWRPEQATIPKFRDCVAIVPLQAEVKRVEALFQELNHAFESRIQDQVYHQADELFFVPYHIPYALWNNCNHQLANWLEALGGKVSGRIFWNPDFIKGMEPKFVSIR